MKLILGRHNPPAAREARWMTAWTVIGVVGILVSLTILVGGCELLRALRGPEISPEERAAGKWAKGPGREWTEGLGGKVVIVGKTAFLYVRGYGVNLPGTSVSDADLHHLKGFWPQLIDLDLSETGIDGSGLPAFGEVLDCKQFPSMDVSLRGTRVTDEALSRFVEGGRFFVLDISDTEITDAGIDGLLKAKRVCLLDLSNAKVTRAGIQRLKGVPDLRKVSLQGLPLTDQDVPMLADLARMGDGLSTLDVSGTQLSAKGVERLREAVGEDTDVVAGKRSVSLSGCRAMGDGYRIAPYLSVARALQGEGKDVAIAKLWHWRAIGYRDQVIVLCRMLFETKGVGRFASNERWTGPFPGGTSHNDWPLRPITLHKNVPILIEEPAPDDPLGLWAYSLDSVPDDQLGLWVYSLDSVTQPRYCVDSCRWREAGYTNLATETLREIIHDFIRKTAWKKALSETERAFLLNQAEPVVSPDKK